MSRLPRDYGALVSELHTRAAADQRPLNGTFELTSRCNLACQMCYVGRPGSAGADRDRELTAAQWLALARTAHDHGMLFLLLTGGEVLARPDFFDVYVPLTKLGLMLTVFSNGTLISETVAQRLAEAPPHRTEITLYGATAATYEAITGVAGSYARCCAGIAALVRRRVPLGLKTTITRRNVHELPAMREMARAWGVPFSGGWLLSQRRDGMCVAVERLRLSPRACAALEATDPIAAAARTAAAAAPPPAAARNFYCQAGRAAFVISPRGEMNACVDLPMPAARPFEIGFRAAWEETQRFVAAAPPLAAACQQCAARAHCPRCPAWSWLETHTLNEPVPYLCAIAQARMEHHGCAADHPDCNR